MHGRVFDVIIGVIKQRAASTIGCRIKQLKINAARPHIAYVLQQLGSNDWRIRQTDQRSASRLSSIGLSTLKVNRYIKQPARCFSLILYQSDSLGQGWLTGIYGMLCCGTAIRFRTDIEALCADVISRRLNQLDDVKIIMVLVRQLAYRKTGRTIGLLGSHKGIQIRTRDTLEEAKPPHAGKILRQLTRLHKIPKRRPFRGVICRVERPDSL